jgi:hypothetical protein
MKPSRFRFASIRGEFLGLRPRADYATFIGRSRRNSATSAINPVNMIACCSFAFISEIINRQSHNPFPRGRNLFLQSGAVEVPRDPSSIFARGEKRTPRHIQEVA